MDDQSLEALGKNSESSRKATLVFTFVLLYLQLQQTHNEGAWGLHLGLLQLNGISGNAGEKEPNLCSL